ncbi:hypothetical protein [Bacteroides acidifaciens]|uniref:hypothetical protein n=1 Tax=Bacteroides acidifaciens TaxID=85831 RepID=UPI00242FD763|nr:hypothetical protein [Bacteroides acidifaciens]
MKRHRCRHCYLKSYLWNEGNPKDLIQKLCTFKDVSVIGKLHSSEHNQSFSANGAVCSLKQDREGYFDLNIDGVSRHSWFRRKKDEFMEALGLPTSRRSQNRGMKL